MPHAATAAIAPACFSVPQSALSRRAIRWTRPERWSLRPASGQSTAARQTLRSEVSNPVDRHRLSQIETPLQEAFPAVIVTAGGLVVQIVIAAAQRYRTEIAAEDSQGLFARDFEIAYVEFFLRDLVAIGNIPAAIDPDPAQQRIPAAAAAIHEQSANSQHLPVVIHRVADGTVAIAVTVNTVLVGSIELDGVLVERRCGIRIFNMKPVVATNPLQTGSPPHLG